MILSATCTSLSRLSSYTFIELTCANGHTIKIQQPNSDPMPYQFGREYAIEIAPVTSATIRRIA